MGYTAPQPPPRPPPCHTNTLFYSPHCWRCRRRRGAPGIITRNKKCHRIASHHTYKSDTRKAHTHTHGLPLYNRTLAYVTFAHIEFLNFYTLNVDVQCTHLFVQNVYVFMVKRVFYINSPVCTKIKYILFHNCIHVINNNKMDVC